MTQEIEGHTMRRFDGELNKLHQRLIEMGALVERQFELTLQALKNKDLNIANQVVARDAELNELEMRADEEVITIIARRTPVARDLRTLMAFSKIITDLERMGDESARIADLAFNLFEHDGSDPGTPLMRDTQTLGRLAGEMLRSALEVLGTLEVDDPSRLQSSQSELDSEFQSSVRRLATFIMEDARNVGHTIKIVLVLKALERIGDHATNIVEYVHFLNKGEDVRHNTPLVEQA